MQLRNHKLIQNVLRWQTQIILGINTLIVLIVLNSCSIWEAEPRPVKQIQTITKEISKTPLNLSHPQPAEMEKVQWRIITPHNVQEVFQEMQNKGQDPVIFGVTEKNYKSMSTNFAQLRGYIIEQRQVLQKYKDYYETDNNTSAK